MSPEEERSQARERCRECGGRGTIYRRNADDTVKRENCPTCHGSGLATPEIKEPT